jgi:hypothetical protein
MAERIANAFSSPSDKNCFSRIDAHVFPPQIEASQANQHNDLVMPSNYTSLVYAHENVDFRSYLIDAVDTHKQT